MENKINEFIDIELKSFLIENNFYNDSLIDKIKLLSKKLYLTDVEKKCVIFDNAYVNIDLVLDNVRYLEKTFIEHFNFLIFSQKLSRNLYELYKMLQLKLNERNIFYLSFATEKRYPYEIKDSIINDILKIQYLLIDNLEYISSFIIICSLLSKEEFMYNSLFNPLLNKLDEKELLKIITLIELVLQ